jgi:hypothetical protein
MLKQGRVHRKRTVSDKILIQYARSVGHGGEVCRRVVMTPDPADYVATGRVKPEPHKIEFLVAPSAVRKVVKQSLAAAS